MTTDYLCRLASSTHERAAYFALRQAIFAEEQGLFCGSDRDPCDEIAYPLVCMALPAGRVVGVVRIWEDAPGSWWGGRLGVDRDFRTVGTIGRLLVQTAVGTARAWGAACFRATVQKANVPFFRRLHWRTLEEVTLLGAPHHMMEADLARYQPVPAMRPSEIRHEAA